MHYISSVWYFFIFPSFLRLKNSYWYLLYTGVAQDAQNAIVVADNAKATADMVLQDTRDLRAALPGLQDKMDEIVGHIEAYNSSVDAAENAGNDD